MTHHCYYFYRDDAAKLDIGKVKILVKSIKKDGVEEYKTKLEVQTYGRPNHWTYNSNILDELIDEEERQNYLQERWFKISQLSAFHKRIMYLKYDYEFNSIRNNNRISKLMCCSEEWVRKTVNEVKERLI